MVAHGHVYEWPGGVSACSYSSCVSKGELGYPVMRGVQLGEEEEEEEDGWVRCVSLRV